MKLTTFLFVLATLQTIGNGYSQSAEVTLDLKDVPVIQVFQEIEKQSDLRFLYINEAVKDKVTTLNVKKISVEKVLDKILTDLEMKYTVLENNLVVITPVNLVKQEIQITGKVTASSTGDPLPGVNIVEKGTMNGAVTDAQGNYTITLSSQNPVLVFSYIGYNEEEVEVGGQTSINMSLIESLEALDEVVVIGYGTTKKTDLTGSVGTVSSDKITAKGSTSVMEAIQGSIPGVNITTKSVRPGGEYDIQIRGLNTFDGNESKRKPLYVVDGVVTEDINFLNPSDIERIDVLKDASSTAIFGSRGSNGVVLVQTKNAGNVKTAKISVSYDGYFGVRKLARLPEFMDGREWMDFRTTAFHSWNATNEAWELTTGNHNAVTQGSGFVHQRLYEEDYEDWIDLITKDGQQQNHYLNISGNAKDITYNIGIGYQNEEGNFLSESFDRYSGKISVAHKPSKYFESGANVIFSYTNFDEGSQYGYRDAAKLMPILHAYDDEGNIIPQPGIRSVLGPGATGNFTSTANPLLEIASGNQETRRQDLITSVYAQVNILNGLSFKSTLSPRFNRTRVGKYYGVVPSNRSVNYGYNENKETFDYTWDNQITFNKTINVHNINATLINSVYKHRLESATLAGQNLPYNSLWYNVTSGDIIKSESGSLFNEETLLSFAGRINYDLMGKYLVTATLRYDGSSKLADKWSAFPSFALAWKLSEEEFLENEWLSNLKFRFSFGYSGNNNIDAYATVTSPKYLNSLLYDFNGIPVSGFAPGDPVNPNLTWEKTRELNFGLDFGFLSGRINGAIDIYDKLSDNLLLSRKLAIESGAKSMVDNIGSVSNKGIELYLNSVNIRTKNISWSTSITYARNKNAIETLYGKKADVIGEKRFIGEPINVIYDYKIAGVWTQAEYDADLTTIGTYTAKPGEAKTVDVSGNGTLGAEDKVILGSPDPDWTGSFTSNLQAWNWDFSFSIYTKQGIFVYDKFLDQYGYNTQRGMAKVEFDYYIPPNVPMYDWNNFAVDGSGNATAQWGTSGAGHENSKYPIYRNATGAYYGDNGVYQDASFVKVKNITLGYTLGEKIVTKIRLADLRIYVNILNPFTFTDYVGWDPEYAATELIDGNGPSNITYQFGINAKF